MSLFLKLCACVLISVCTCIKQVYYHSLCLLLLLLGEKFERGIQDAVILESDEALLVTAQEEFDDVTEDGK